MRWWVAVFLSILSFHGAWASRFCTEQAQNDGLRRCQWYMDQGSYAVFSAEGRSFHVASRSRANLELQKAENSGFCQRIPCNRVQNCTTEFAGGSHYIYAQIPSSRGSMSLRVARVETVSQVSAELAKLRAEGLCR